MLKYRLRYLIKHRSIFFMLEDEYRTYSKRYTRYREIIGCARKMRLSKRGCESRECLFSEIRHCLFRSLFRPCHASPSPTHGTAHRVRHPTLSPLVPHTQRRLLPSFLPSFSLFLSLFLGYARTHKRLYIRALSLSLSLFLSFILTVAVSRSGVCEPRDTMLCLRIAGLTYFVC